MTHIHTLTRLTLLLAASTTLSFASDNITLDGMESGYFVQNLTPQAGVVITNDFAEGAGAHIGKFSVVAREQINAATGAVTEGAFVITDSRGDTLYGTYTGQATFEPTKATWVANGRIEGGTGRFAGSSGTIKFTGSSDFSTCKSVSALSVCSYTEWSTASISLP
jgi:hypothetical protein